MMNLHPEEPKSDLFKSQRMEVEEAEERLRALMEKQRAAKQTTMTKKKTEKWSAEVTEHSNAMDLEQDIFKSGDPEKIAASLKHSAETSKRRKASPYRSAMSMLTFYENRAGKNLSAAEKQTLEKAKDKLRELFGKKDQ